MSSHVLVLPDGKQLEATSENTFADVVSDIGAGLARNALAVTLDSRYYALADTVPASGDFSVITKNSDEGLDALRHSAAHLLAWAAQELFPGIKFGFGPAVEGGFYYDFDREQPFTEDELQLIEKKMVELAAQKLSPKRLEINPEANELSRLYDQAYRAPATKVLPRLFPQAAGMVSA